MPGRDLELSKYVSTSILVTAHLVPSIRVRLSGIEAKLIIYSFANNDALWLALVYSSLLRYDEV